MNNSPLPVPAKEPSRGGGLVPEGTRQSGRIERCITTYLRAESTFKFRREAGTLGGSRSRTWATSSEVALTCSTPGLPVKGADVRAVAASLSSRFYSSCGRRRHRVISSLLECSLHECTDVLLNVLQKPRRRHVSHGESVKVLGYSLSTNRLWRAWQSTRDPGEGQFRLCIELAIKPVDKPSWEVVSSGPRAKTLLKSRRSQPPTKVLHSLCGSEPTIPFHRMRGPPPHFPRTSTRSNTTGDQATPESSPKLSGLPTSSTTRIPSSRPAAPSLSCDKESTNSALGRKRLS